MSQRDRIAAPLGAGVVLAGAALAGAAATSPAGQALFMPLALELGKNIAADLLGSGGARLLARLADTSLDEQTGLPKNHDFQRASAEALRGAALAAIIEAARRLRPDVEWTSLLDALRRRNDGVPLLGGYPHAELRPLAALEAAVLGKGFVEWHDSLTLDEAQIRDCVQAATSKSAPLRPILTGMFYNWAARQIGVREVDGALFELLNDGWVPGSNAAERVHFAEVYAILFRDALKQDLAVFNVLVTDELGEIGQTTERIRDEVRRIVVGMDALVAASEAVAGFGPALTALRADQARFGRRQAELLDLTRAMHRTVVEAPRATDRFFRPAVVRAADGLGRFRYEQAKDRFVGRDGLLSELIESFLARPAARADFRWHVILGEGGVGKSRLAHELIHADAARVLWPRSGFINPAVIHEIAWNEWQPEAPTFIVIDDAAYRGVAGAGDGRTAPQRILDALADADSRELLRHPVRLLLLEREVNAPTMEALVQGCSESDLVKACRHTASPVVLAPLERRAYLDVMRRRFAAAAAENAVAVAPLSDEALEQALTAIDPDCRPLFAAIVGEELGRNPGSAAGGGASSGKAGRRALLEEVISNERGMWLRRAAEISGPKAQTTLEAHERLLALATMTRGLELDDLAEYEREVRSLALPTDDAFDARLYERMSDGGAADGTLAALQPDLIGELFVEGCLAGLTKKRQQLVDLAWRIDPTETALFAGLSEIDYGTEQKSPLRYLPSDKVLTEELALRASKALVAITRACAYRYLSEFPDTAPPWQIPPLDATEEKERLRDVFGRMSESSVGAKQDLRGEFQR